MKLTTKVRYGTRALAELAQAYPTSAVSLRDVAEQQMLSVKYLEQIMMSLKSAGLVESVRGARGGYGLARPPADISIRDIYRALDGTVSLTECVDEPARCPVHETCPTRDLWADISGAISEKLGSTTLQDIVAKMESKAQALTPTYEI